MTRLNDYQIILRPITTEKSVRVAAVENKYTFEVDVRANKVQIAQAVETVFGVTVEKVNVINNAPKFGHWQRKQTKRKPATKKAIVSVSAGERIEAFGV
jgi:large subunit ribosomal protein L23